MIHSSNFRSGDAYEDPCRRCMPMHSASLEPRCGLIPVTRYSRSSMDVLPLATTLLYLC
uniref:Uncharacterized protein n=1 Tax=Arundo donax TaxID=35708 RepID=A0A0A9HIX1_ARUDO